MKFSIDKKRLDNVVTLLNNYVEKRDNSSINSCISISSENDNLILKATDMEMGIKYIIRGCDIIEPGQIYINSKKLNDILKGLDSSDVVIYDLKEKAKLVQNKTQFDIPLITDKEFIFMDENDARIEINISTSALAKGLKMISSAIDTSVQKIQFNCAHIEFNESGISFAGSDTKIISVFNIPAHFEHNDQLVLPKRSVVEILKLFSEDVKIYKSANYLIIENDNFTFYNILPNIKLLPYKAAMPKYEVNQNIILPTKAFIKEIKKLNTISDKSLIRFEKSNKIIFRNKPFSNIENDSIASSELDVNISIKEDFEIFLLNRYMLDFLNQIDEENFELQYFAPAAPVIFKTENFMALIASIKS